MKRLNRNKDFSIYKNYLCKSTQVEKSNEIILNHDGFKRLLDESISTILEKELDMKYIAKGVWATSYNNHRRKTLQLFFINDRYATFKWGWNFDFIPKQKGNKLVFARTDKQADSHIFEVSNDFYRNTYNRKRAVISSYGTNKSDFNEAILNIQKNYIETIKYLLPIIKEYYINTDDYQKIIEDIDIKMNNSYYCIVNPEMGVVKIFIKAFLGDKAEAIQDLKDIRFNTELIKEKYFSAIKELFYVQEKMNQNIF